VKRPTVKQGFTAVGVTLVAIVGATTCDYEAPWSPGPVTEIRRVDNPTAYPVGDSVTLYVVSGTDTISVSIPGLDSARWIEGVTCFTNRGGKQNCNLPVMSWKDGQITASIDTITDVIFKRRPPRFTGPSS
jgi:hypothetical protein